MKNYILIAHDKNYYVAWNKSYLKDLQTQLQGLINYQFYYYPTYTVINRLNGIYGSDKVSGQDATGEEYKNYSNEDVLQRLNIKIDDAITPNSILLHQGIAVDEDSWVEFTDGIKRVYGGNTLYRIVKPDNDITSAKTSDFLMFAEAAGNMIQYSTIRRNGKTYLKSEIIPSGQETYGTKTLSVINRTFKRYINNSNQNFSLRSNAWEISSFMYENPLSTTIVKQNIVSLQGSAWSYPEIISSDLYYEGEELIADTYTTSTVANIEKKTDYRYTIIMKNENQDSSYLKGEKISVLLW